MKPHSRALRPGSAVTADRSAPAQLALELRLDSFADFESFEDEGNAVAVAHLRAVAAGEATATAWLHGAPSSGKSHLLQATCRAAAANGSRAMYLALGAEPALPAGVLQGLEALDLIAIDDAERVAGHVEWDEALFALWNGIASSGASLLLASRRSPRDAGFALPDLASRACACFVYRIVPLDEAGRLHALLKHARQHGLELDAQAAGYLLQRIRRDMREVCAWLERLDRMALAEQRRVTIPLIRQALLDPDAAEG